MFIERFLNAIIKSLIKLNTTSFENATLNSKRDFYLTIRRTFYYKNICVRSLVRILDLSGIKGTHFDYFGQIPSIKIELYYVVSLAARKEKDIGLYLCRTIAELVRLSPF